MSNILVHRPLVYRSAIRSFQPMLIRLHSNMDLRPFFGAAQRAFAQRRSTTAHRVAVDLFTAVRRPSMHLVPPSNLQLSIQPMSFLPEARGFDRFWRPIEHTGSTAHDMHIRGWMTSLTRSLMHVWVATPQPCSRIGSNRWERLQLLRVAAIDIQHRYTS